MDTKYWTKETLYSHVDVYFSRLGLAYSDFPIDSKRIASEFYKDITLEIGPMKTMDICGILFKGEKETSIALNAMREPEMHNFDCMHELIHYFFHDITFCKLICAEGKKGIAQDGDFCHICGASVVNRCTNEDRDYDGNIYSACGTTGFGNSRYCHKCGSQTTFLRDELLKPWNEKTPSKISINVLISDEDLPF